MESDTRGSDGFAKGKEVGELAFGQRTGLAINARESEQILSLLIFSRLVIGLMQNKRKRNFLDCAYMPSH